MKTNFEGIKEVIELWEEDTTIERGFVKGDIIKKVVDILELNKRDKLNLQNLRDFTVVFINSFISKRDDDADFAKDVLYSDCISAVTHLIDTRIMR